MQKADVAHNHEVAQNQLKGMQSVRTTFRLSDQGEKIFEELVKDIKITMKEWFDGMLHVVRMLELTNTLAEGAAARASNPASGIRKTWVISREALSSIKSIAKENKVSRDALVESLIFLMDEILRQARQKRPENLKKALELVRDFQDKADDVHSQLLDLLGDEDPVSRFYDAVSIADIVAQDIQKALDQAAPQEQA